MMFITIVFHQETQEKKKWTLISKHFKRTRNGYSRCKICNNTFLGRREDYKMYSHLVDMHEVNEYATCRLHNWLLNYYNCVETNMKQFCKMCNDDLTNCNSYIFMKHLINVHQVNVSSEFKPKD